MDSSTQGKSQCTCIGGKPSGADLAEMGKQLVVESAPSYDYVVTSVDMRNMPTGYDRGMALRELLSRHAVALNAFVVRKARDGFDVFTMGDLAIEWATSGPVAYQQVALSPNMDADKHAMDDILDRWEIRRKMQQKLDADVRKAILGDKPEVKAAPKPEAKAEAKPENPFPDAEGTFEFLGNLPPDVEATLMALIMASAAKAATRVVVG